LCTPSALRRGTDESAQVAGVSDEIRQIVAEVLRSYQQAVGEGAGTKSSSEGALGKGIFADVDSAVGAASEAQRVLVTLPLETRRALIEAMRRTVLASNESLSAQAVAETGLGNAADKQVKNALAATKTPTGSSGPSRR
jgi:propionaldehyde dehydrogenase